MHHASVYLAPCPISWCLLLTAFQDVTTSIIAMEDVDQSHLGENQRRLSVVHAASHVSIPNNQDVSQLPGYPNAYHIAYHGTFYRKCRYAGQIKLLHIYIHLPHILLPVPGPSKARAIQNSTATQIKGSEKKSCEIALD